MSDTSNFKQYGFTILKIIMIVGVILGLSYQPAQSREVTFIFKAPKAKNPVDIRVDSLFEMNKGTAAIIDGNLCLDPPTLDISCGKIIIPSSAIIMSNRVKTSMLHSKKWLNKNEYPNIIFEFHSVKQIIQSTETIKNLLISGELTIKGTTKPTLFPIKIICDAGFDQINKSGVTMPELSIKSSFSISRAAFNIKPGVPDYIVDDTIFLDIHVCGIEMKDTDKAVSLP